MESNVTSAVTLAHSLTTGNGINLCLNAVNNQSEL